MSIGVLIGVHDGVVLASDSASTLTITAAPGALTGVANVYDNANKIFNLYKGLPIGCVTFGSGSIGNSSIGTLIKDLRAALMSKDKPKKIEFNPKEYTVEDVSKILANFLGDICKEQPPAVQQSINTGFLIGGYSSEGSLGESWRVDIKAGKPEDPKQMRSPDQPGISWGGMGEAIQRLVMGYGSQLFQVLAEIGTEGGKDIDPATLAQKAGQILSMRMQAPIVFAPMPIQDAIDLARFLVDASIKFSRFIPGPQVVGGPIEIAAITKHEQFKWISRKHYFEQNLNREPEHVVVDNTGKD